ncbi:7996_t:CDS:2 [Scutellospora calospora]|uniref:7996_t:CDS:1 n=1 Tax=Scutellospora calospora TaxID=85575 RepID=A0ACA9K4Q8_9GLOM|nr:7996_t:CDS:2 [Scutellospora calospora]
MTKLFANIFFFLLVISIPFYVSAYPTGAGTCDVALMTTQGHGPSQTSGFGGYSLSTTKSGQQFSLTIQGTSPIKGVLLYVQDSSGKKMGTFTFPSNYQACSGSGSAALTHTSSNMKSMPLSFTWTPPSGNPSGNMTVRGIVVQSYQNWHPLPDMNFDLASGVSSVSNNTNLNNDGSGSSSGSGGIGNCVTEAMLKNQRTKAKYNR